MKREVGFLPSSSLSRAQIAGCGRRAPVGWPQERSGWPVGAWPQGFSRPSSAAWSQNPGGREAWRDRASSGEAMTRTWIAEVGTGSDSGAGQSSSSYSSSSGGGCGGSSLNTPVAREGAKAAVRGLQLHCACCCHPVPKIRATRAWGHCQNPQLGLLESRTNHS